MAFLSQQMSDAVLGTAAPSRQQGVYAVVRDDSGHVLVIRTDTGRWYLPGGRIEAGETPAAALRREIAEECGWTAELVAPLCRRNQSIFGGAVALDASYWRARLVERLASAPEHEFMWLSATDAAQCLHRASDRAALAASLLD